MNQTGEQRGSGNKITGSEFDPLINITHLVYALQALSCLVGITYLVAVVVNYVKLDDVRGTWLESHFRWQIRTFWFGVLWISLCIGFVLLTLGIGILIAWIPAVFVSFWFIYRIARGWMALNNRRPMYA